MDSEKIKKLKNVFSALDNRWLIRHYFFVGLALILVISLGSSTVGAYTFLFVSAIFYPFAMFIYENVCSFLMGENFFIFPIKFLMIWKFVRFIIVWCFAIPIGILGFLYLYYRVNKNKFRGKH
ncbi:hypothetical protein MX003_03565 [Streptococcus uberis]|uniref:Uncharacterized protein n=1 Tax=Streptococcus uberis TaxID=1349 RepID=A0A6L6GBB2_STRUB|nr:hypothetical protein [Streptococcus uberis]MCK1236782.1 hypothetical protein [Streptococcus uberis]MTB98504.1 hypothetical protein [Streptococcus uberis]MTC83959.1 hypothetical protein [Streptococcus uberis]MTC87236.1 hypothetical protein [Streptococcus uberis]MTD02469.1 hypothetical protein [Streptococcus uberis]